MENNTLAGLDTDKLKSLANKRFGDDSFESIQKIALMIRVAHCARVSYLNFEGEDDYEADVKLHDRLSKMCHWSPFEHCARAMSYEEMPLTQGWSGNFQGFIQLRKTMENENGN